MAAHAPNEAGPLMKGNLNVSVTLKLADDDARLVGEILARIARLQGAALMGSETEHELKALNMLISSTAMVHRVTELSGAFISAVRANER